MTSPSVRFVMEQGRCNEAVANFFLEKAKGSVAKAVHDVKSFWNVRCKNNNRKPHIYLAQYPSGKSYWRVCGSKVPSLDMEAHLACNELNHKHRHGPQAH